MNSNSLRAIACILMASNLHPIFCSGVDDPEFNLDLDRSLPDCWIEEADPHDMGSYSHTTKCNKGHKKRQGGDIAETVVKQGVYRMDSSIPGIIHADTDTPMNLGKSVSLGGNVNRRVVDGNGNQFIQFTETTTKFRKGECVCPTMDQTPVMIYMRQMIGSLLDQMGVRYHNFGPGETMTIDLQGEISYAAYMDLTAFLSSTDGEGQKHLQLVSEIISNLLHTVHSQQPMGSMGFMAEKILFHLPILTTPKFWLILFSLTVIGFTTVVLCCLMLRASDSPARLLVFGALLFFVFSCVWIYAEMHENSKAENAARLEQFDTIPRDCQYNNFTQWERVKYFFRVNIANYEDECAQYYRETLIDPFYRNTPVEAIAEAAARFVFHPLEYIGEKCGAFLNSFTSAVPLWMRPFLLIMIFLVIFFGLFPYRIRTPFLSIEPVSRTPVRPALPVPQQEQIAGPIVPLHRLDAATDTDDLEEFILRQQMGREREDYVEAENQMPRLLPTSSSWNRWSKSALYYIITFSNLVLQLLTTLLRDVPQLNGEGPQFPEEEDIWGEHHQNQLEIMPEEQQVQIPMSMPIPEVPLNSTKLSENDRDREPAPVGTFGYSERNSGQEDGFLLDFDETTQGSDDELLEGEIFSSPCTETGGVGAELGSTLLGFQGLFCSNGIPPSSASFQGSHHHPFSSHLLRHRKNS